MKSKVNVIICPHCGREYLPAEIYMPHSFLGKPKTIVRTETGKIDSFLGSSMDLHETYECDKCGTLFNVKATISFESQPEKEYDFNQEYSSPLRKSSLFLTEIDD